MKIIVACGGTGGHTFPGLAVAEELVKRGHEVIVWTSGRAIESSVMKRWTGAVFATGARQLSLKNLPLIIASVWRCWREMSRQRPEALVAMGSYSSLPPVLAARMKNVKVYLHEANTVPGKAVEFLSRFANAVAISFEMTARFLPGVRTVLTGLPIRADIVGGQRFDFVPHDAFTVFVTGGSQGAHAVNELMTKALVLLAKDMPGKLYVIHQTGANDEAMVKSAYQQANLPSRVHAFENEMANAFATADVVVARAGASTCFELAACGKPTLFIPLPTAMRNHQHFNADAFVSKGAADEVVQEKTIPRTVERFLFSLAGDAARREKMAERMREMAVGDAAAKVADLVTSTESK